MNENFETGETGETVLLAGTPGLNGRRRIPNAGGERHSHFSGMAGNRFNVRSAGSAVIPTDSRAVTERIWATLSAFGVELSGWPSFRRLPNTRGQWSSTTNTSERQSPVDGQPRVPGSSPKLHSQLLVKR
jgi:hypothetical protein